jgi:hypothetical protein
VTREVMDRHQRKAGRRRRRLGERHADQKRSDETGTLRHRHGAQVGPGRLRLVEAALDDATDVANMLARGQLGHDPAPFAMNRHLRGDDVGSRRPRLRRVAGLFDDGGGSLVAGRFDSKDQHVKPTLG